MIDWAVPRRRRARHWVRQGNAARDRRDWPAARAAYASALDEHPPLATIWVQYGHAAKESGDLAAAEAAYRRALALQPGLADGYLQLGHALKLQGQASQALEAYTRATTLDPQEPEHQFQLGHALKAQGRPVAALDAFRRAAALGPGRADAVLELGQALLVLGEPVGALEAFRQAFRLEPRQPAEAWVQHGHAARDAGDLAAAEAAYRQALAQQPAVADTHLHLGEVLRQRNQPEAAAAAFAAAASLAPGQAGPQLQLGQVEARLDRPEAALAAYDRALALAPGDPEILARREAAFAALPPLDQASPGRGQGVSIAAVRWAMRLFAGREPADLAELDAHRAQADLEALRRSFAGTPGFAAFHRGLTRPDYAMPLFLLAPSQSPQVTWCFTPPSLSRLSSQLCTAAQLEEPNYAAWCGKLGLSPAQHRKPWEFCFIGAALEAAGLLRPEARGLGFGCGQDPLPAYFTARGVTVLATEAPAEGVAQQGRHATNEYAAGLDAAPRPALAGVRTLDMNHIPADLAGFDFCWSAGAPEHLGSLRAGLDFIVASLGTLRPGGIAVHTTEFNLTSNEATMETPALSLFRRRDIEQLIVELAAAGHAVAAFNTHPGDRPLDAHIGLPPYALPHLKRQVEGYVTTSLGLIIRKAA